MKRKTESKPLGFLQVDVDGLWAVCQCYGKSEGKTFQHDPAWSIGIPNLAEWFADSKLKAGFFLVGRDLKLKEKVTIAQSLVKEGHEIGNHSWSHTLGMTLFPTGKIIKEIRQTQEIIEQNGLPKPIGFRSPGYDIDSRILRAASRCGLQYDASLLPTWLSPIMRMVDAWAQKRIDFSKRQFGRLSYARAPREPFYPRQWQIRKPNTTKRRSAMLEIPVGVLPGTTFPLTASGIFTLGPDRVIAGLQKIAAEKQTTLMLLHAVDGLGYDDAGSIARLNVPGVGFDKKTAEKRAQISAVLQAYADLFDVRRACDVVPNARRNELGLASFDLTTR